MNNLKYPTIITAIAIVFIFGILIISYVTKDKSIDEENAKIDLSEIIKRDTLIALTSTSHIDYFIYRGTPMGFQLELLENFADYLDINLRILVENDIDKSGDYLLERKCDLIAMSLTLTKERALLFNFSDPIAQTKQVLVQPMPDNYKNMSKSQIGDSLIRNQVDLAGKKVHVLKSSPYANRLRNLSNEIAEDIFIIEIDSLDTEQIIGYVSHGVFDYTVADENIARFSQQIFPNIDIETPVSFPQNVAWAVRKESEDLLDTLNYWLKEFKLTREYITLTNRYFDRIGRSPYLSSIYYSSSTGIISEYDDIIRKYSKNINWDWRLLASLIYHESRFDHTAVSWAGAYGIMQLMPATAEELGVDENSGVDAHINAGVRYINFLDRQFKDVAKDSVTRIKLILASYNIGYGHVEDAIRLTKYHGKDVNKWSDVQYYLINLNNPEYFNNDVVKNGHFPGIHGVVFANTIFTRYLHYRNTITAKIE